MSQEQSREDRRARWTAGIPLTFAFLKFGNERQLQQQIENRGTPRAQMFEDLMTSEIFGMLFSEKLVGWGFRTAPSPSDGPIPIPPDVFHQPLPATWRDDIVSASGETYERITVSPRHDLDEKLTQITSAPIHDQSAVGEIADKGGPRDTYELSRDVLAALAARDEKLISLSAERLLPDFQSTFRSLHSEIVALRPPPALRTLRTHLKRFRAEHARQ